MIRAYKFLLRPTAGQEAALRAMLADHCSLYNGALQERRDAYWRQGSACENYDAIECAVFAVGGWEDGYSNAVARLVEKLKAPCIGLAGP